MGRTISAGWCRGFAPGLAATALLWAAGSLAQGPPAGPAPLGPLPELPAPDAARAELGRYLFFDTRLSGDDTVSCATCHDPGKAFTDGRAMSLGYPGSQYFRNTPTVINAVHARYLFWDGRLPGDDLPTLVRDHVSEAHFMQADGRLVIERMRQVPVYEQAFQDAFGGEPTYGRILDALAAFVSSLRSREVPLDRFLAGDEPAISAEARRGLELFRGKAGCLQCHHGPLLADGGFHNLGLGRNPEIAREPERHATFRRFFRTLGVSEPAALETDPGLYALTKRPEDRGSFRTPSLREVAATAPYMHDGSLATLQDVIELYDAGGGPGPGKDPALRPLRLTRQEKADLVAFLETLTGDPIVVEHPPRPDYALRTLGAN